MLEKHNPNTCTFFTPVGEMGFALHEMFLPYKEYILSTKELYS